MDNLILSYDNTSRILDGAGSQLQRVYGIYALSRFLGISYIHTSLQTIPYQGLLSLEKNKLDPDLVTRYNTLLTIPSDGELPEQAKVHHVFNITADISFLWALREELKKKKEYLLLKIDMPFSLVNQHPQMIHYVKAVSPFERPCSSVFKIVIHVRRGDLLISPEGNRMLPNSYYINLTLHIIEVLKRLHIPFSCELHTETPSQTFVVTSEHHGMQAMKERVKNPVTLNVEESFLDTFDVIPHLKKCNNHDPIEALHSFATADLFIMSRSSFSYLGAMLNKKGIIVYHPFWFGTPLEWLDATHKPSFQERLEEACKKWKRSSHL
ncbi:MAG: hypothetical protein ACOYK6_05735 [Chthoniobacterales bacterium]